MSDGRRLADFSLVDQPTFGLRLSGPVLPKPSQGRSSGPFCTEDLRPGAGAPDRRSTMNTGLHAIGWGLQRLAIALGVTVFVILFALTILVTVLVVGQAAGL